MVDVSSGITGWAPASYLVPVDDSTLKEETQENQELIGNERGKAVNFPSHSLVSSMVYECICTCAYVQCMRVSVGVLCVFVC